jgi:histidinol-phosphate/aromatic aminotransferase/cobyric acid decarboxylase-like protein
MNRYEMPTHRRITVGREEENDRVIESLAKVLSD